MKKLGGEGKHVGEFNNIESRNVRFFNTDFVNAKIDSKEILIEEPKLCTHCNKTGQQFFIEMGCISGNDSKFDGIALYACPFCKETTVAFLLLIDAWAKHSDTNEIIQLEIFTVIEQLPKNSFDMDIPDTIQRIYKNFTEIFFQAKLAEEHNLHQLAGMGYRKSIEFLVTDFLMDYPSDETVIKEWLNNPRTTLKNKIDKLPTERLRKTANAIAFIGNDETHYTVRNPDYNIHDMKKFIALLIKELEGELIYDNVEDFFG